VIKIQRHKEKLLIKEIIVGAYVTEKKKLGSHLSSLSKMAIRERGGKVRDLKKIRNCEVFFCLQ
jgi:hypothetical protein